MGRDLIQKEERVLSNKEKCSCLARGYDVSEVFLGGGAVGRVFLAEALESAISKNKKLRMLFRHGKPLKVAIKIIYADIGAQKLQKLAKYIPSEIGNMNRVFGHPNIVKLLDVFIACQRVFLVTELASQGSLKKFYRTNYIENKERPYMTESEARYYFREIVQGVRKLHIQNIAHRDLKLDNILITETGEVKLGDFGFSILLPPFSLVDEDSVTVTNDILNSTLCGTPCFMAPEVLKNSGGYNAIYSDIWSLGVVLYIIVNGSYPFPGRNVKEVLNKIIEVKDKELLCREHVSHDCKDLIMKLLKFDSWKRPSASRILEHSWLRSEVTKPAPPHDCPIELDEYEILQVKYNAVPNFQEKYVRSYLLQRSVILSDTLKKMRKMKAVPKSIICEFGVHLAIPRRENSDDCIINEVWRLVDEGDGRVNEFGDVSPDCNRVLLPNYGLKWASDWAEVTSHSTLGITPIRRVIHELSILKEWRNLRDANKPPKTELQKCIQLRNSVDLDEDKPWPLPKPIPRPTTEWAPVRKNWSKTALPYLDNIPDLPGCKMSVQVLQDPIVDQSNVVVRFVQKQRSSTPLALDNFLQQNVFEGPTFACEQGNISSGDSKTSVRSSFVRNLYRGNNEVSKTRKMSPEKRESRLPVHSSRKQLEDIQKRKESEERRRRTLPSCAFYTPRGVPQRPKPKVEVEPLDLSRVLHRSDSGSSRIPSPRKTWIHDKYPSTRSYSKESSLRKSRSEKSLNKRGISNDRSVRQRASSAASVSSSSRIPLHSSRKALEEHLKKKNMEEERRRRLPSCAFYTPKGVTVKPKPTFELKKLDLKKMQKRPNYGFTKIPKPKKTDTSCDLNRKDTLNLDHHSDLQPNEMSITDSFQSSIVEMKKHFKKKKFFKLTQLLSFSKLRKVKSDITAHFKPDDNDGDITHRSQSCNTYISPRKREKQHSLLHRFKVKINNMFSTKAKLQTDMKPINNNTHDMHNSLQDKDICASQSPCTSKVDLEDESSSARGQSVADSALSSSLHASAKSSNVGCIVGQSVVHSQLKSQIEAKQISESYPCDDEKYQDCLSLMLSNKKMERSDILSDIPNRMPTQHSVIISNKGEEMENFKTPVNKISPSSSTELGFCSETKKKTSSNDPSFLSELMISDMAKPLRNSSVGEIKKWLSRICNDVSYLSNAELSEEGWALNKHAVNESEVQGKGDKIVDAATKDEHVKDQLSWSMEDHVLKLKTVTERKVEHNQLEKNSSIRAKDLAPFDKEEHKETDFFVSKNDLKRMSGSDRSLRTPRSEEIDAMIDEALNIGAISSMEYSYEEQPRNYLHGRSNAAAKHDVIQNKPSSRTEVQNERIISKYIAFTKDQLYDDYLESERSASLMTYIDKFIDQETSNMAVRQKSKNSKTFLSNDSFDLLANNPKGTYSWLAELSSTSASDKVKQNSITDLISNKNANDYMWMLCELSSECKGKTASSPNFDRRFDGSINQNPSSESVAETFHSTLSELLPSECSRKVSEYLLSSASKEKVNEKYEWMLAEISSILSDGNSPGLKQKSEAKNKENIDLIAEVCNKPMKEGKHDGSSFIEWNILSEINSQMDEQKKNGIIIVEGNCVSEQISSRRGSVEQATIDKVARVRSIAVDSEVKKVFANSNEPEARESVDTIATNNSKAEASCSYNATEKNMLAQNTNPLNSKAILDLANGKQIDISWLAKNDSNSSSGILDKEKEDCVFRKCDLGEDSILFMQMEKICLDWFENISTESERHSQISLKGDKISSIRTNIAETSLQNNSDNCGYEKFSLPSICLPKNVNEQNEDKLSSMKQPKDSIIAKQTTTTKVVEAIANAGNSSCSKQNSTSGRNDILDLLKFRDEMRICMNVLNNQNFRDSKQCIENIEKAYFKTEEFSSSLSLINDTSSKDFMKDVDKKLQSAYVSFQQRNRCQGHNCGVFTRACYRNDCAQCIAEELGSVNAVIEEDGKGLVELLKYREEIKAIEGSWNNKFCCSPVPKTEKSKSVKATIEDSDEKAQLLSKQERFLLLNEKPPKKGLNIGSKEEKSNVSLATKKHDGHSTFCSATDHKHPSKEVVGIQEVSNINSKAPAKQPRKLNMRDLSLCNNKRKLPHHRSNVDEAVKNATKSVVEGYVKKFEKLENEQKTVVSQAKKTDGFKMKRKTKNKQKACIADNTKGEKTKHLDEKLELHFTEVNKNELSKNTIPKTCATPTLQKAEQTATVKERVIKPINSTKRSEKHIANTNSNMETDHTLRGKAPWPSKQIFFSKTTQKEHTVTKPFNFKKISAKKRVPQQKQKATNLVPDVQPEKQNTSTTPIWVESNENCKKMSTSIGNHSFALINSFNSEKFDNYPTTEDSYKQVLHAQSNISSKTDKVQVESRNFDIPAEEAHMRHSQKPGKEIQQIPSTPKNQKNTFPTYQQKINSFPSEAKQDCRGGLRKMNDKYQRSQTDVNENHTQRTKRSQKILKAMINSEKSFSRLLASVGSKQTHSSKKKSSTSDKKMREENAPASKGKQTQICPCCEKSLNKNAIMSKEEVKSGKRPLVKLFQSNAQRKSKAPKVPSKVVNTDKVKFLENSAVYSKPKKERNSTIRKSLFTSSKPVALSNKNNSNELGMDVIDMILGVLRHEMALRTSDPQSGESCQISKKLELERFKKYIEKYLKTSTQGTYSKSVQTDRSYLRDKKVQASKKQVHKRKDCSNDFIVKTSKTPTGITINVDTVRSDKKLEAQSCNAKCKALSFPHDVGEANVASTSKRRRQLPQLPHSSACSHHRSLPRASAQYSNRQKSNCVEVSSYQTQFIKTDSSVTCSEYSTISLHRSKSFLERRITKLLGFVNKAKSIRQYFVTKYGRGRSRYSVSAEDNTCVCHCLIEKDKASKYSQKTKPRLDFF